MKEWYLHNTPENEQKLIDLGFVLPKDAPKDRFDKYRYVYGSLEWVIMGRKKVSEVHDDISEEYMKEFHKINIKTK